MEGTPKLPETARDADTVRSDSPTNSAPDAESVFWQDLRDDLRDPEFREAFVAESERLTAEYVAGD